MDSAEGGHVTRTGQVNEPTEDDIWFDPETGKMLALRQIPGWTTSISPTVFVCYRREDSQHAAGRLHDKLTEAYGSDRVFMDIDSVPLGVDFVDHVSDQIARCAAVVVMIGRQWLKIKDKSRRRRLDNEDDLVRAEIAAALRQKIPVIPVLVEDSNMPSAADLPDNIRLLARRNGIELSAIRWKTDVERLIKELDRVMKPSSGSLAFASPTYPPPKRAPLVLMAERIARRPRG